MIATFLIALFLAPEPDAAGLIAAGAACAREEAGAVFLPEHGIICLDGHTDEELAAGFADLIERHGDDVRLVGVSGPGGPVMPALDIADEILVRGLDTVVTENCISSCAQFLFMAGEHKYLLPDRHVFIHGGPTSEDRVREMDLDRETQDWVIAQNRRFADFYARIGVDLALLTTPPPSVAERLRNGQIVFWAVEPEEMASHGVRNAIRITPPEGLGGRTMTAAAESPAH